MSAYKKFAYDLRLDGKVETVDIAGETDLSADTVAVIRTVLKDYEYLIH
mgnify:FL=1